MTKKSIAIAFVVATMALSSCRLVDFTVISSKNVTLNVDKNAKRVIGKGFTVKGALDAAIEKAGPGYDALIDGVIYNGLFRYKVEGTPIKSSEQKK
jgi:hypothetical protein